MDSVELQPLTDEEITSKGLSQDVLWMIKHNEEAYGPYEPHTLREHALQNVEFYSTLEASLVTEENWVPFFEARPFVRRTPKLVSTTTLQPPERFWTLHNGQRQGPFGPVEIQKAVTSGALLASDLISVDDGGTWQKIFELKYFEKTQHSAAQLPEAPHEDFFDAYETISDEEIEGADPIKEGVASLAYLGTGSKESVNLKDIQLSKSTAYVLETEESAPHGWRAHKKAIMGVSVSVAMLALMITTNPFSKSDEFSSDGAEVADASDVELMPAGSSLMDETPEPTVAPRRMKRARRMPANSPMPPSPRAQNGARQKLARMQETHDEYNTTLAEEPTDAGLYPEDNAATEDASARQPSSTPETNDDGYRMEGTEEPAAPAEAPIVEEVGDF